MRRMRWVIASMVSLLKLTSMFWRQHLSTGHSAVGDRLTYHFQASAWSAPIQIALIRMKQLNSYWSRLQPSKRDYQSGVNSFRRSSSYIFKGIALAVIACMTATFVVMVSYSTKKIALDNLC